MTTHRKMPEAPMKKTFIALGLTLSLLGLAGCSKNKTVKTAISTTHTIPPLKERPLKKATPKTTDTTNPSKSEGKFGPIFFSYDESGLSDAAMIELNDIAFFLEENPDATLLISGHADERGTEDYNMALGQERAESIKTYLTYMRIDPSRIQTVSYGEEMPLADGLDEESLAKNRRGEFEVAEHVAEKAPVANKKVMVRPKFNLSPKLLQIGKAQ
jgi:peptidoglycan-associated lipoprotein